MRIAIFDNNFSSSDTLRQMLYVFSNNKKIDFVVDVFENPNNLSNSENEYILIFISYNTQDGIKIAQKLFENCVKTPMVIFSDNCCHAVDAFKINAFNFLQTPLCQNSLFEILENFFISHSSPLIVNSGRETVCINTDNIFYLEADNKHCRIHLKNDTLECNKTMAQVFSALPEERFLKINRAFVVNSDYIARFCSKYIILTNGDTLYPSRHFYKSFKADYLRITAAKIP